MRTLLRAMAAVGLVAALATGAVVGTGQPTAAAEPGLEADYVARLNAVRADRGVPALAVDGELTAVARAWSDRMAGAGAISHNPDVGAQVSAPWTTVGENVGAGAEVGGVMAAFVASPSHLENIVDPIFDFVGVGVTWGSDGRMYTTHVFMDLDGGVTSPAPPPTAASTSVPATTAPAVPAPAPADPPPPAPAPAPSPPPAAFAADRVATVLALVGALDAGVR